MTQKYWRNRAAGARALESERERSEERGRIRRNNASSLG